MMHVTSSNSNSSSNNNNNNNESGGNNDQQLVVFGQQEQQQQQQDQPYNIVDDTLLTIPLYIMFSVITLFLLSVSWILDMVYITLDVEHVMNVLTTRSKLYVSYVIKSIQYYFSYVINYIHYSFPIQIVITFIESIGRDFISWARSRNVKKNSPASCSSPKE